MRQVAIVLVGGLGTRIRPAIGDIPKCLAPIGETFFLKILLDSIFKLGVGRVILSLGFGSKLVIAQVESLNLAVEYFTESEPLGTGGAIKAVMDAYMLEEALVYNGDSMILGGNAEMMLSPLDFNANEICRIASVHVPDKSRFGGLLFKNNRVTNFLEKGEIGSGLINAGIYRISSKAFINRSQTKSFSLELDIFPALVPSGALSLLNIDGKFIDIGIPEDYLRFKKLYMRKIGDPKIRH